MSENLRLSFLWMVLKASQYACTKLSVKPMNKTELLIKFSAFHSEINYSNGDKISERFFFKAFLVHSLYP